MVVRETWQTVGAVGRSEVRLHITVAAISESC